MALGRVRMLFEVCRCGREAKVDKQQIRFRTRVGDKEY